MEKILLFIPCYNCEKQITRVLDKVSKYSDRFTEILIINNLSTDNTENVAKEYITKLSVTNIKIVRNKNNYGLGGSHKSAFDYAIKHEFDYVVVLHGDDQGNIEDLIIQLESKSHANVDCLLGARFMSGSKLIGYSKFRTFGNIVYNWLFSIVVGFMVKDLGSGLNCYKVSILKDRFYLKFPDNLTFNYCMVMAMQYYKHKFRFFPISWSEDDQVSNVRLYSQAKKVLGLLLKYTKNKKNFIMGEHRDIQHKVYEFEVVIN